MRGPIAATGSAKGGHGLRISRQSIPVLATLVVCIILYVTAAMTLHNFGTLRVFVVNLVSENAILGIVAIGMTFVILSGGIDLSVGAVIGCTSIAGAVLVQNMHWHPVAAFLALLAGGILLGSAQGFLIQRFELPPFLITLAGMFFCQGLGLWISSSSIQIDHAFIDSVRDIKLPIAAKVIMPFKGLLFVVVLGIAAWAAKYTRFGRAVYAIGGSEQSALLMGLPVARTKISIYALSGFLAALAGVTQLIDLSSGDAIRGVGLELDVIAMVVIGGTLLSGGVGSILGTSLGLLIFAIIQTGIIFQGTLSSWWAKIFTGALLLAFILMQRSLQRKK